MKTRVILNPSAGAKRARQRLSKHRLKLEKAFGPIDWRESHNSEHVRTLAQEAAANNYDRVLVAGGDGTVHFAVNGLVHTETALGIIPVGTGNDVAASIGIPMTIDAAIDTLIGDHQRAIDVAQVYSAKNSTTPAKQRVFTCVLGLGMDTAALKQINDAKILKRGRLLYSLAALKTLLTYKAQPIKITYDGKLIESNVFFAALTNTQSYAGGMRISPRAKVDDGLLDLCIFPNMGTIQLIQSFAQVFHGKHIKNPKITTGQCAKARIDSPCQIPITLDGELTDLTTPIDVRALPASLRVLGAPIANTVQHDFARTLEQ